MRSSRQPVGPSYHPAVLLKIYIYGYCHSDEGDQIGGRLSPFKPAGTPAPCNPGAAKTTDLLDASASD